MTEQTFNGWMNHASWAISLHINNDPAFLSSAQGMVRGADDPGDALHDWFLDGIDARLGEGNDLFGSLLRDLLPTAKGEVDWDGIAAGIMPYTAGWNMPGYLGETPPEAFVDVDDAIEYIVDAIDRHADSDAMVAETDEDIAVIEKAAAEAIELVRGFDHLGVRVEYGNLAYWIQAN